MKNTTISYIIQYRIKGSNDEWTDRRHVNDDTELKQVRSEQKDIQVYLNTRKCKVCFPHHHTYSTRIVKRTIIDEVVK